MARVDKLSIALTPEIAGEVRDAVARGEYASASEVIRDALRAWKQAREARSVAVAELRRLWREGIDSGSAGPSKAKEMKRRDRARVASRARNG
jgi:antitoxin ParD1/3/4